MFILYCRGDGLSSPVCRNSHKPQKMKNEIESYLISLIGQPLIGASRAASMQMFGFGNWVDTVDGEIRKVSEYALHLQCAWRITSKDKIFVGQNDMFYPSGNYETEPKNWNWDVTGNNRCDEKTDELIDQHVDCPLIVEKITADEFGSLNLQFSENFRLEIFSDNSLPEEFWRFFKPTNEENHFVVGGNGIEFE